MSLQEPEQLPKFCKGICKKLKAKHVRGLVYKKYKRCRVCKAYFYLKDVKNNCPCCGRRLRTRPRSPSGVQKKKTFSNKIDSQLLD